jgi:hypothetical protein
MPAVFRKSQVLKRVSMSFSDYDPSSLTVRHILDWLPESVEILDLPMNVGELGLPNCDWRAGSPFLFKTRFPGLKSLSLPSRRSFRNDPDVVNYPWETVLTSFPNTLQSLSLSCDDETLRRSFILNLHHLSPNLESLKLDILKFFNLSDLSRLTRLQSLSLRETSEFGFDPLFPLSPALQTLEIDCGELIMSPNGVANQEIQFSFFAHLPPSLTTLKAVMFNIEWDKMPWWGTLLSWTRLKGARVPFSNFSKFPPNLTFLETEKINSQILEDLVRALPKSLRHLRLNAICAPEITAQFPRAFLTSASITMPNLQALSNLPSTINHLLGKVEFSDPTEMEKTLQILENLKIARYTYYKGSHAPESEIPYDMLTYCLIPGLKQRLGNKEWPWEHSYVSPFHIASMDLIPLLHFLIENQYFDVQDFEKWEVMAVAVKYGSMSFLNWLSSASSPHIIPSLIIYDSFPAAYQIASQHQQLEAIKWLESNHFETSVSNDTDDLGLPILPC